jgi:hypothetical protein
MKNSFNFCPPGISRSTKNLFGGSVGINFSQKIEKSDYEDLWTE